MLFTDLIALLIRGSLHLWLETADDSAQGMEFNIIQRAKVAPQRLDKTSLNPVDYF